MSPPGNADRRPHEGNGGSASGLARPVQNDTPRRQTPLWHAHADVRTVVGRAGNPRLILIVNRCPGCRQAHLHQARVPFLATVRKGACGAKYMVHAMNAAAAA